MKRSKQRRSGGKPEKSKYAKKVEDRLAERRGHFEFCAERRKPEDPPPRPPKQVPAAEPRQLGIVSGRIALLAAARGYFFIVLDDGTWVHVGLSLLRPAFGEHSLCTDATLVTCEAAHFPGARNPRATKVLSVVG